MMVQFSVLPVSDEEHIAKYVAAAVKIVDESGLDYKVTPMGTVITGEWAPVMETIRKCHEAVRGMTDRVVTKIQIDYRKQGQQTPADKIKAVEKILGKEVKK